MRAVQDQPLVRQRINRQVIRNLPANPPFWLEVTR